jgi:hypothetical protein
MNRNFRHIFKSWLSVPNPLSDDERSGIGRGDAPHSGLHANCVGSSATVVNNDSTQYLRHKVNEWSVSFYEVTS